MPLSGRTVVVTGAGRGIGRALAIGFASDGADVVAIGRTRADLEETAAQASGRMVFIQGSVGCDADVNALFELALARFGKVDVLVNNAALYPKGLFLESPFAEWEETIQTNVIGMARCCRIALPLMLERRHGRIINVGSFAWRAPIPASSAYSASKAAVAVLTKAIAGEIDRSRYPDVLVNELLPGVFRTGMSDVGDVAEIAYPYARSLALLPAGGPHGQVFLRDAIHLEAQGGLRARLRRVLRRR